MDASIRTSGERTRKALAIHHRGFTCGQIPMPFSGGQNPSGTGYGYGDSGRLIVIVVDRTLADATLAGA